MAHSPKVMGGGAFVSPFEWNENSIVIIKYKHGGGHIRAHPHNHELCDHKGGQTEWAKWKVHLSDNGRIAQLEHLKTHKYLQMDKFLTCINVASEGGNTSRWIVHPMGSNCVRLESERNTGYFLGVKPHDGVTVVNAANLDSNSYQYQFTYLYFFIEGQKDEGYFKKPYLMKQQNTIIIKHPQKASLRTNPNDERELDINGQKEMNARWEAMVTLFDNNDTKSNNTTNSNSNDNSELTTTTGNTNENSTDKEKEKDKDKTDSNNNNENNNDTNNEDSEKTIPNGTVKTNDSNESNDTTSNTDDTNNNNNKNNSDKSNDSNSGNTENDNSTVTTTATTDNDNNDNKEQENKLNENKNSLEKQTSGESKDDDSDEFDDSHEKTNIVLQFRSVKSGGYIKLDDNKITMSRKGDECTKFRVYIVQQPNIVKLESTKHPGSYIRVTVKRGIHVGKGGPHCQMTLLRKE